MALFEKRKPESATRSASNAGDTTAKPIPVGAEDYGDMLGDFFGAHGALTSRTTDEDYRKVANGDGEVVHLPTY